MQLIKGITNEQELLYYLTNRMQLEIAYLLKNSLINKIKPCRIRHGRKN